MRLREWIRRIGGSNETENWSKKNWSKLDHGRRKLALLSCIVRQKKKRLTQFVCLQCRGESCRSSLFKTKK